NPDVLCNREIKFDVFLKAAMELGADYVATGHYCRKIEHENGTYGLLSGLDPGKDQSYFLCQLTQEQLSKALFPIGELQKSEVRDIAREMGLHTADKKDSQGLCFVGKISLPQFLQQQLVAKKGDVIEIPQTHSDFTAYDQIPVNADNIKALANPFTYHKEDGVVVAEHQGAHFYTIGQRKGLSIGGRPQPSFVIGLDVKNNLVYSGQTDEHSGLNRWALKIDKQDFNFINTNYSFNDIKDLKCSLRIRYRQAHQDGTVIINDDGIYVLFDQKQRGITPGQFAAIYIKDELIASGVIEH
ncbi:tRNA 2-thiouridine(34) synthase MnmA, partial [bacterium]|nr:tRNA 2-thiouridine(34) synthase MnmA [bacterium]